jgi:hypothetical protein
MTTQIKGNATSTFGGDIDVTGNVVTDAPAFRACISGDVTITNVTYTKLPADKVSIDTNNCYDNVTNYRFTPNVEGYYQVNASIRMAGSTSISFGNIRLDKNGSNYALIATSYNNGSTTSLVVSGSDIIYLNGTTDYLEFYGYASGVGTMQFDYINSNYEHYVSAILVRAA